MLASSKVWVGIVYDTGLQLFKAKNDQSRPRYPLRAFIDDYYKLDLDLFKEGWVSR